MMVLFLFQRETINFVGMRTYHNYNTIGRGNASCSLILNPDTPQDEFVV